MGKQMDRQQARRIIQETFELPFDKNRFVNFIRNLLNRIEEVPFVYKGNYIPDAFEQHISTLERIAKYSDGEHKIDILIIHLRKETSIERARTMQRNFIAWYLNGSRGGDLKDAALAAFVSPDDMDWRFSLVKMDYKFDENGKVKEEFTPARRWSFLVGANENSHTAQSRLVKILADIDRNPTLKQLEEAFNIETVTKEFFLKYRDLFIRTKEALDKELEGNTRMKADFEPKGVNTVDFAKKLLGQIVFLYFLQKKGWFGVARDADWGDGSKQFLRELFEKKHSSYENFFNDILEPLFYEALRVGEERKQDNYYYSRFNCKIPFLNGGLFDPIGNYDWVHTDIKLPDSLFSNNDKTKEGDTGDGILDIFDRYNFTVKEDEPLEKEVAIDPELLGKAYEKFNAIRPDNFEEYKKALKSGRKGDETKFNKQFGVYYTPREIVHYMCQQSLINYLFTELNSGITSYEKLGDSNLDMLGNEAKKGQLDIVIEHKNTEISKEDIVTLIHLGEQVSENEVRVLSKGKETKTYYHQLPESIRKNAKLIDDKLADITVCDPAVGSGAFPVGMMGEIVKARSVLSIYLNNSGHNSGLKPAVTCSIDNERNTYNLKRRCIEYSLYGVDIDPGAVEIAKLRLWLSLVVDEEDIKQIKPLPNLDYKIVCGNSLLGLPDGVLIDCEVSNKLEENKKLYFNSTNPSEKNKIRGIINNLFLKLIDSMKKVYPSIQDITFDFHTHFSEVFHGKGGFDVMIANPPYIQLSKVAGTPDWYKKFLKNRFNTSGGRLNTFIFFIHLAFGILKNRGNLAFIIPNTILTQEYYSATRELLLKKNRFRIIVQYSELPFEEAIVENVTIIASKETLHQYEIEIFIDDLDKMNLVERNSNSKFLANPNFTINVNSDNLIDKIYSLDVRPLDEFCYINQAIALKGDRSLSLYTSNPKGKYYKKLDGRNIGKYHIQWDGVYLDWDLKRIHSCKTKDIFLTKEKLFFRRVSEDLIFAYDNEQYFALNTLVVVNLRESATVNNLKCLLALLNSRLMNYIYKRKFKSTKTVFSEIQANTVGKLPVLTIPIEAERLLTKLVDHILAAKRTNLQADTSTWEKEIDQLVYQLYGLSEEEIKIVEGVNEIAR
ncbi:MAG: TaqI-like C-terminal specificity domain-containing protein [Thermodesulfobacteriota bacterium]